MSDAVSGLIDALERIAALLRGRGERHWLAWIERDIALIHKGDAYGIEHFLSAYGGMGSFNDFYLCPENKDLHISEPEVGPVNTRFSELRSRAYDLASGLQRELASET
jgi:hypothetical protein